MASQRTFTCMILLSQDRPRCVCPDAPKSFCVLQVIWAWLCRGAGNFATGMVLIRQGQEREGKLLLGKALRFAHGYLCNQQLVSQVREMAFMQCVLMW